MESQIKTQLDELVIEAPAERAGRHPLAGPRLIVGRSGDADIRFDSPTVSRQHAELARDPTGNWWLSDLKSHNGTHVNGCAVEQHQLKHLDQIQVGDLVCVFHDGGRPTGRSATISVAPQPRLEQDSQINSVTEFWSSSIRAEQLSLVVRFADSLLEIEDEQARLVELCRLMIGADFHGMSAVGLRLEAGDAGAPPQLLCEPQNPDGVSGRLPYLSSRLLHEVRQRQEACLASMGGHDKQGVQLTIVDGVSSIAVLACPIYVRAQEIDLLYVEVPKQFGTGDWLALVVLAVEQFRHAHEAWASRRLAVHQAAIDRELELARQMQQGLLPQALEHPGLSFAIGFEPCRWIAGDYVDVMLRPGGTVILMIADVCGKGVQAALVTMALHSRLHANIGAGFALTDAIKSVDDYLEGALPPGHFVTMIAVELDPRTGALECVNAGHPPPLIVRHDGSTRQLSAPPRLPLGISSEPFALSEDMIGRDDFLFLYTDGVTETFDPEGKMLGIRGVTEGLAKLATQIDDLTVAALADRMMAWLRSFRSGGLLTDDTSLMVARCEGA